MVAADLRGTEIRKKRLANRVNAVAVLELMAWKLSCMKPGQSIDASRICKLPGLRSTLKVQVRDRRPGHTVHYVLAVVICLFFSGCSGYSASIPASDCSGFERDFLVLVKDGSTIEKTGNLSLLHQELSPASTIKPAMALALLRDGFNPGRKITVNDKFIKGTPRAIDLSEALLFSSNDYFRTVAGEKEGPFFRNALGEMQFFPGALPDSWPEPLDEIVHGAGQKTTALHQLEFMDRMLRGELADSEKLIPLIEWPRTDADRARMPEFHIYGKTGAWDQTVWFVGGARHRGQVRSLVVVTKGHWTRRKQAIQYFYCTFAQQPPDHPLIP